MQPAEPATQSGRGAGCDVASPPGPEVAPGTDGAGVACAVKYVLIGGGMVMLGG